MTLSVSLPPIPPPPLAPPADDEDEEAALEAAENALEDAVREKRGGWAAGKGCDALARSPRMPRDRRESERVPTPPIPRHQLSAERDTLRGALPAGVPPQHRPSTAGDERTESEVRGKGGEGVARARRPSPTAPLPHHQPDDDADGVDDDDDGLDGDGGDGVEEDDDELDDDGFDAGDGDGAGMEWAADAEGAAEFA
jgi:hypothetical protein